MPIEIISSPTCNFCGKSKSQVNKLLTGETSDIHICDECVKLSYGVLKDQERISSKKIKFDEVTPKWLHHKLNEYVIGQEHVKKSISVAVYNHYKRLTNKSSTKISKSNVLLLGPTGVGKTLIAQTLANTLKVPFVITDATTMTESGYAGDDVEVLIHKLFQNSDYDIDATEMGIIYVDEIDKKAKRNDLVSLSRDVSGEGVQQSLLKLMEGTVVTVPNKPQANPERVDIDTKNILFIVGGAFVGLENVVTQRMGKTKIGFQSGMLSKHSWEDQLETTDLVQYGLIPEFLGRLPSVNILRELTHEDLVRVLTEPKDCLVEQIRVLFSLDNIDLEFTIESINRIADIAITQNLGARGLRKILDDCLMETQYDLPDLKKRGYKKATITPEVIDKMRKPHMQKGSSVE